MSDAVSKPAYIFAVTFVTGGMLEHMDGEIVDIVDGNNQVLYQLAKVAAHEQGLLHRTVIGEVRDTAGNWILVKQSADRQDAGQFVSPVGGHVRASESEVDALKRETLEEIGIDEFSYEPVGKFVFNRKVLGRHENHYFIVYKIITDKSFVLGNEADDYETFTEQQLYKLIKSDPELFGDAFYAVLKKFYPHILS